MRQTDEFGEGTAYLLIRWRTEPSIIEETTGNTYTQHLSSITKRACSPFRQPLHIAASLNATPVLAFVRNDLLNVAPACFLLAVSA